MKNSEDVLKIGGDSWVFYNAQEVLESEADIQQWNRLLQEWRGVDVFYRSHEWLRHQEKVNIGDKREVAVFINSNGEPDGLFSLLVAKYKLRFAVAGRPLITACFRTIYINGSEPMIRGASNQFHGLMQAINEKKLDCDAVYCDSVDTETEWWRFIANDLKVSHRWFYVVIEGPYIQHSAKILGSFSEYLSARSSNTRNLFKQKLTRLRKMGNGCLKLEISELESDIHKFLRQAADISSKTWQSSKMGNRINNNNDTLEKFRDLAQRGLLRSYILVCGEDPCAFLLGYQGQDVYYAAETGYDPAYATHSPGIALWYLVLEDLYSRRSPNLMSFGVGDAWYKTRFSNSQRECRSVLILRSTLRNFIIATTYRLFQRFIAIAKRVYYRDPL